MMNKIEEYKERIIKLIEDANSDKILIQPYTRQIDNNVVDAGFALFDGGKIIRIQTYEDASVEILE